MLGHPFPIKYHRSFLALLHGIRAHHAHGGAGVNKDCERYPCEPLSSRDHLFFGSTDDLSMSERRW